MEPSFFVSGENVLFKFLGISDTNAELKFSLLEVVSPKISQGSLTC